MHILEETRLKENPVGSIGYVYKSQPKGLKTRHANIIFIKMKIFKSVLFRTNRQPKIKTNPNASSIFVPTSRVIPSRSTFFRLSYSTASIRFIPNPSDKKMNELITSLSSMTIKDKDTFCALLKSFTKKQLNTFDECQVVQSLRKFVHEERKCRKEIKNTTALNTELDGFYGRTSPSFTEGNAANIGATGGGVSVGESNNPVAGGSGSQPSTSAANGANGGSKKKKNKGANTTQHQKKKTKNVGPWSMYSELHSLVAAQIPNETVTFNSTDTDVGVTDKWNSNIVGAFQCPKCRKKWRSGKIAVQIRHYGGGKYNAKVFHQHCDRKSCNTIARPELDEGIYTERVSFWVKRWLGYHVAAPDLDPGKEMPPHRYDLCEGCRHGCCMLTGYNSDSDY